MLFETEGIFTLLSFFFFKKNSLGNKKLEHIEFTETISDIHKGIEEHLLVLDASLNIFKTETHTSLDTIITASIKKLTSSVHAYSSMIEKILVLKQYIVLDPSRKRSLLTNVTLMQEKLKYPYGAKVLQVAKNLNIIQSKYLADMDTDFYIKNIKEMKKELIFLKNYITELQP